MATSNIKLFDENKGNMLSDSEFNISTQRLNGLQTGVASSQLQNKAMYQASLVAYAIAQVMMQNGKNANDTDAVSAFVANLSGTMLQKVYDLATTEEAKAGTATGKWMSPALVKAAIDTLAAKANNILSSSTKALYGLGGNATPDDVLALLSRFNKGLGNEYVWEKRDSTGIVGYVNSPGPNVYPPAVPDGYTYTPLGQMGAGLKMYLLWENTSPTSTFDSQTVSVNLAGYQYALIVGNWNTGTDNGKLLGTPAFIPIGEKATFSQYSAGLGVTRDAAVSATDIIFGKGYNGASVDNNCCVPVYIFGVKGVTV